LNAELLERKLRDSFNAEEACKFLVVYYAWIEIVMVLYSINVVSTIRVIPLFVTDVYM